MEGNVMQFPTENDPQRAQEHEEFQITFMNSIAFNHAAFPRDWLIKRILMLGQAGVIGGPKKTLKTSLLVDMAVSVGTGRPFLGHFPVPMRRRVAVFSGESDPRTLQQTARGVCAARGVTLNDCHVCWNFRLPRLCDKHHLWMLHQFLREHKIELVFLDPLYLCLLGGTRSVSASNLYEVGPLLWAAADACLSAGATPVLVHHATKSAGQRTTKSAEPLDLDDLAFAGIGEFARQWVLVSRREPFDPRTGLHRLVLSSGGSAGHSGCWNLTVEEGAQRDDFGGRNWRVQVENATAGYGEETVPVSGRRSQRTADFDDSTDVTR
jgi:hypothetical protein